MAKFGKFVSKSCLPMSEEEKQEFIKRITALVEQYDKTLKFENEPDGCKDGLTFVFTADKTRKFKNIGKSRISFAGFGFMIFKNAGYLENLDWTKMERIDKTKPEKDYDSAPPFQYSARMWVTGGKIPYRCRRSQAIANIEMYQYGTEFDDIDFNSALWQLYNKELKPMGK